VNDLMTLHAVIYLVAKELLIDVNLAKLSRSSGVRMAMDDVQMKISRGLEHL
jgi:hypothetical protein